MRAHPTRSSAAAAALLAALVAAPARSGRGHEAPSAGLELTLPPAVHAVVGEPLAIYYDNVVLTETPERYRFQTMCPIGADGDRCWTATPADDDGGGHPLRLLVYDGDALVAEAATTLHVAARDAGRDRPLALLIVGDSLTHATLYPNELARLLSRPGDARWRMLGTHRPAQAAEGVAHEGYGGWTWERFVRHHEPAPDPAAQRFSSPFVFLVDGQPRLDVRRYLDAQATPPDVVLFMLGINDCFGADPESRDAIDQHVDRVLAQAETLLAAFHEAAPQADLAICTTPPPNARESGFEANYQGRYHRWGWKRIQHRLVQRQLAAFAGQEQRHRFLVPTNLALDPVDGYPVDNGVHPNALGYRQIGGAIYAWLKGRLEAHAPDEPRSGRRPG
jgi:lysophospholipase L1-like esterase